MGNKCETYFVQDTRLPFGLRNISYAASTIWKLGRFFSIPLPVKSSKVLMERQWGSWLPKCQLFPQMSSKSSKSDISVQACTRKTWYFAFQLLYKSRNSGPQVSQGHQYKCWLTPSFTLKELMWPPDSSPWERAMTLWGREGKCV